jgi:hypothetical protein
VDTPFDHERKYAITRDEAEAFFARVAPHVVLEVYDQARPIAWTRTTYLDDDELSLLKTSEGPVQRRMRVREYAAAPGIHDAPVLTGVAFLELKATSGSSRLKARQAAAFPVLQQLLGGLRPDDAYCAEFAALSDPALVEPLRSGALRPRVSTWYRRASLAAEERRVRITYDEGLVFAAPCPAAAAGTRAEPTALRGHGPSRLLEVKLAGPSPSWLTDATRDLAEARSLSKYHLAMTAPQALHRTLPLDIPAVGVRGR